jgi:predicted GNAT family N-acyltransferase
MPRTAASNQRKEFDAGRAAMIPNDFTVSTADWANEKTATPVRTVREQVYIVEQKVREEDEWDEFDEPSRHVLARDGQGNPIGTGRLTPNMMIGRMAVLPEWRGREVGAMLLVTLLEQARALHYPAIELHAQTQAVRFYERFGFERLRRRIHECGIAHVHMRMESGAAGATGTRRARRRGPKCAFVPIESRDDGPGRDL